MINVTNTMTIHEVDGNECIIGPPPYPELVIKSHPTYKDFVIIEVDGHHYTVAAADLIAAIHNAKNKGSQ